MKMINNDCNGLSTLGILGKIIMKSLNQRWEFQEKNIMKMLDQRWVFCENNVEIA